MTLESGTNNFFPKIWYLTTNRRCKTSQKNEDLRTCVHPQVRRVEKWRRQVAPNRWYQTNYILLHPKKYFVISEYLKFHFIDNIRVYFQLLNQQMLKLGVDVSEKVPVPIMSVKACGARNCVTMERWYRYLAKEHKMIFPPESCKGRRKSHREQILTKRQHNPTRQ